MSDKDRKNREHQNEYGHKLDEVNAPVKHKPVIIQEDDAEFLNATFDSASMSDGIGLNLNESI